ncbi:hypothetical protein DICPUDRAFT_83472, partial [Dictyostelium purpureum]
MNPDLFNNLNEHIFWKVFHNKFLFKKIIFSIEDIIIDYKDLSQYYLGNKIKFKHISNLKFFNKNDNKEWSILKDKLISNQFLKIDKDSIVEFIYHCKNREIIQLFLEKKKDFIPIELDLVSLSLENSNMVAFQVFLDQGYPASSKSVERAIHFGNIDALNILFKQTSVGNQKYWLKLFRNKYIQLEMIEFFISKNETLLHDYGQALDDKEKLDFTSFFSIKSLKVKSILLDFNLVEKNEVSSFFIYFIKNSNFGLIKTEQDLLFYIRAFFKLACNLREIPLQAQLKIDEIQANKKDQDSVYQLTLILLEEIQKKLHP